MFDLSQNKPVRVPQAASEVIRGTADGLEEVEESHGFGGIETFRAGAAGTRLPLGGP
ncbi:MAG: hypothetical protein RIE87_11835 [Rhodospirillales bacterium]